MGVCAALRPTDLITSTHRGHGHALAKGLGPAEMFAELMGRDAGVCRGRGGSMHIADPARGIFGANGIVAAGLPIAVGAGTPPSCAATARWWPASSATARSPRGCSTRPSTWPRCGSCPCCSAARTTHSPSSHRPAPSTAPAWAALPRVRRRLPPRRRQRRGAVNRAALDAVSELRSGSARSWSRRTPTAGRALRGGPQTYRDPQELSSGRHATRCCSPGGACWRRRPRAEACARSRSRSSGRSPGRSPRRWPPPAGPGGLLDYVLAERPEVPGPAPVTGEPVWRAVDAVHDALAHELAADPTVFLAGIDVGEGGNVFGLTRGLHARSRGGSVTPRSWRRRSWDGGRCGDGRHAPGRRDHVHGLPRGLLRPAAQPDREAALHDRWPGQPAAGGAHPVRRRPLLRQPALAKPGGAARAHPRTDRGDAVDARRHLRAAAGGRPRRQPGHLHREPPAVRRKGPAPGRTTWCRSVGPRSSARATRHGGLVLKDGPRGVAPPTISPPRASSVEVIDLRTVVPWDRATVLASVARPAGSSSPTRR